VRNINFDFKDRHVLVTGGAQGIGFEIAKTFLQSSATVTIADYAEGALDAAKKELQGFGELHTARLDVTDRTSCQQLANSLAKPLNVLINNAGITRDKSFSKMTDEDFDKVVQTNLTGVFNVTKALMEKFDAQQPKRIINMASVVALYGNFGQTNYAAAKAGVVGMTKTWAREFGKKGFAVNAVAPGVVDTPLTRPIKDKPDWYNAYADRNALKRWASSDEMAGAVIYLASDAASYVTGTVLFVDGGWTAVDGRFTPPL
jgi:3-oxoacyl-[acyl-carrier protein] reductase